MILIHTIHMTYFTPALLRKEQHNNLNLLLSIQAILVTPTGWANAATIDVIYDLLHMMGRDDIPVGRGDVFALNQSDPIVLAVGNCKYNKAIPHGSGGFLDSDTLYGLARDLPRSPRRFSVNLSSCLFIKT